ncbi:hypothetical protein C8A03DRAFT_14599, partial [Achaetomium macrosporum]
PVHLHKALNIPGGRAAFLFVHDAANPDIEESIQCMHRHVELLLGYGGRGFWVNIVNSPSDTDIRRLASLDSLASRFEDELDHYKESFGRRVLELPIQDAYKVVLEGLFTSHQFLPGPIESSGRPEELSDKDFWDAFMYGRIAPWRHKHYLRAAYLTLLQPENRELGLLEVATKFARVMNSYKQRNSNFQLQPESRTLTVFWLYHVKLALEGIKVFRPRSRSCHFKQIFYYIPELEDENFPTYYYSSDILKSEYAEKFWMLPDLRKLIEPPRDAESPFRQQITNKQQEDPDRVLRFVFAVVQRYLRPGETRRRSWFINLAFASLQRQTMRLRAMHPSQSQFSVTQAYFYLQMVHAALSQLSTNGQSEIIQDMSYPLFKATFGISPLSWKEHYSPQVWDSLQARAAFVAPDLRPLPDTINPPNFSIEHHADRNEAFRRLGVIPELPSLEILHFHQAVLLEDAKSIAASLTPSQVTTHAHLLKYIHTHLVRPSSPALISSLAREHLTLLASSDNRSPLSTEQIAFYLSLSLHILNPPHLHNADYNPPIPFIPSPACNNTDPKNRIRFHSCPCHFHLPLPYEIGPNAEWEAWVRGESGLVLCWDGAWKVGREGVFGGLGAIDSNIERGGREVDMDNREGVGDSGEEYDKEDSGDGEERKNSEDEQTLCHRGGEGEGEGNVGESHDEEWEVVSEGTLC